MKRFLMLVIMLTVAFFAQVGFAADVNTTFGWQQDNINDVASWDVFRAPAASGPWTLLKNQAKYTLVPPATEYQTTAAVNVPDNAQTTVWFKAQTLGTTGLRSVDSNIISKAYDTRTAPAAPGNFNVK
jgi:hypothetical protein